MGGAAVAAGLAGEDGRLRQGLAQREGAREQVSGGETETHTCRCSTPPPPPGNFKMASQHYSWTFPGNSIKVLTTARWLGRCISGRRTGRLALHLALHRSLCASRFARNVGGSGSTAFVGRLASITCIITAEQVQQTR